MEFSFQGQNRTPKQSLHGTAEIEAKNQINMEEGIGGRWSAMNMNTMMLFFLMYMMIVAGTCKGTSLELKTMYRYSEEFRSMRTSMGLDTAEEEVETMMNKEAQKKFGAAKMSYAGTLSFYEKLVRHDRRRHRRLIDAQTSVVSLSPYNRTVSIDSLGGLHYTIITIGTPPKQFLVALDTGSELLWVPCDCIECAKPDWSLYGIRGLPEFAIYSPSNSSTSKTVQCSDTEICVSTLSPGICINGTQPCSYNASYLSANTSSSGILVQDTLYLNSESTPGASIKSNIYFGCGKVQTGDFLTVAPNGLFGLGPDVYSVPSTLARNSLIRNVFSICFNERGSNGSLIFGRKPSSTFSQTPLVSSIYSNLYYILKVSSFVIANSTIQTSGVLTIFDTGTSITILNTNVVKAIADTISNTIGLQHVRVQFNDGDFTLNCWSGSNINDNLEFPLLSVVFDGKNKWDVTPYGAIVDNSGKVIYLCLLIIESTEYNIIGYNFMNGYEYFFDRESSVFSWAPSNCTSSTSQEQSSSPAPTPGPSLSPQNSSRAPSSTTPNKASKAYEMKHIIFAMSSTIIIMYHIFYDHFLF